MRIEKKGKSATGGARADLEVRPTELPALAHAAVLHLEGKPEAALAELERALHGRGNLDRPARAAIHSAIGYLHFECRRFDRAAETYSLLLEIDPRYPAGCYNLALCLESLEQWHPAACQFAKALEAEPTSEDAQLGLGACRLRLGVSREALEIYERCLCQNPESGAARFGKAVALQLEKRFREADELYREILKTEPASEECLSNLIAVSAELGNFLAVREFAERLLAIRPGAE